MNASCVPRRTASVALLALTIVLAMSAAMAAPLAGATRTRGSVEPDYVTGNDGPVAMALDAQGVRWAVWSYASGLERDIAVSRNVAGTWSAPALIGQSNGVIDGEPAIGFLPDGRAVIAWTQMRPNEDGSSVVYSFQAGLSWSAPQAIPGLSVSASSPRLIATSTDLVLVFVTAEGAVETRALVAATAADSLERRGSGARSVGFGSPVSSGNNQIGRPSGAPERDSGSNGPDPMPTIRLPPPSAKPPDGDSWRGVRETS